MKSMFPKRLNDQGGFASVEMLTALVLFLFSVLLLSELSYQLTVLIRADRIIEEKMLLSEISLFFTDQAEKSEEIYAVNQTFYFDDLQKDTNSKQYNRFSKTGSILYREIVYFPGQAQSVAKLQRFEGVNAFEASPFGEKIHLYLKTPTQSLEVLIPSYGKLKQSE